ncbi:MAG: ParA family protein [Ruminococcaceae bacterium]|jgi:chromosome partitioning protein|nr:ParA family protein [Oscillospiraceae bacterium]
MPKPYTIAFANQKGGVGKTTSCVNIASIAAEQGLRVLLVDSDPQGNSTSGVGVRKREIEASAYEVLIDGIGPADCVVRTQFKNLSLVPSTLALAGAEIELFDTERRERRMREFLEKCGDDYDLAVIDCPPSLSLLTVNALAAADSVVIPMQCEYYALEGLIQLMMSIRKVKELYNPSLAVLGILITMYNGRLTLTSAVLDEIKKHYGDKLLKTTIPRAVRLSEAPGFGEPINYHDRYSKACEAYRDAANELLDRIGLKPKKS